MATIPTPSDFIEFLKLLNKNNVEYLLVGGYAVGLHGYVRATGDLDVWIAMNKENANRIVKAVKKFGFTPQELKPELFLKTNNIIRMGETPIRIEIMTTISGVNFRDCYPKRITINWNGVDVPVISLKDLIKNKKSSGRLKDLADAEQLEALI